MSRRKLLSTIGVAASGLLTTHAVIRSDAFTTGGTDRSATAPISDDSNGVIGAVLSDTVSRNQRDLLAQLTNNASETLSLTVALDTCSDGTLYGPDGGEACSVTFPVNQGQTREVDFEGTVNDDVSYVISAETIDGAFTASLPRTVTVEAGNNSGTVTIDKLLKFRKHTNKNDWSIQTLEASSDSADLDRIELTVRETGTGNVVGERVIDSIQGQTYSAKGTGNAPALRINPSTAGYTVQNNITYRLTVVAFDVNGNTGSDTATN